MSPSRPLPIHVTSLAVAVLIASALLAPIPSNLAEAASGASVPIDKVVHFAIFLAAGFPWLRSLVLLGAPSPRQMLVLWAAAYGGLLEVAQGLWTSREPEVLDLVAGALGAWAACLLVGPSRDPSGNS